VTPAHKVTALQARAFLRRAHRVDSRASSVGEAIAHHGYVQIDPINVCGRMHDHILRNRVERYAEGGLMRHLHGGDGPRLGPAERTAFEHHLPSTHILVAFPAEAWPHLRAAMRARVGTTSAWSGRLTPRERELAVRILERVAAEGPLGSDAFDDTRKGRRVWGAATLPKATLQKLFFHGRLLIAGRDRNRRLYDVPERVLPASILGAPEAAAGDTARWLALTRLRQHRLVALKRAELPHVEDLVEPVAVGDGPALYCLRSDVPLFFGEAPDIGGSEPLLLAPLDPLIYDRRLTRRVWGFDYTWEAYVPPSKRRRGHYALPVLAGTELVGHVDLKADRPAGRLVVVSRAVRRGHRTAAAVAGLARFLGLRSG
jgi:uncharacterized protein YcaQ